MLVYKFGGTSVADANRLRRIAKLVRSAGETPVVVVSALGGVTDRLVDLAGTVAESGWGPEAESIVEELRRRHRTVALDLASGASGDEGSAGGGLSAGLEAIWDGLLDLLREGPGEGDDPRLPHGSPFRDAVSATGEDLSTQLAAAAFRRQGVEAEAVDVRTVMRTDASFGRARPLDESIRPLAEEHLASRVARGIVPVVQGFVGATEDGRTTTLGRGGSDFSAAILGGALGASEVAIWTDVDGILSGDPRQVDEVKILREVGYEEAVELSYFGARVIHPGAAKHAVSRGVSLRIRNTFNPSSPGTLIRCDRREVPEVAAVAYKPRVVLIKVRGHPSALPYGFLARVFDVLGRHRLPVDLVATSHSSTAFTIDENEEISAVREELGEFAEVEVVLDLATVTVVGNGLLEEPGMDALVFWAVGRTPIHLISQASNVSLSFLVDLAEAPDLVRRLHRSLVELRGEAAFREAPPDGGAETRQPLPSGA